MPSSSSSSTTTAEIMLVDLNNLTHEDLLKMNPMDYNHTDDEDEISKLVNLLILRVETLNNDASVNDEKNNRRASSVVKEIDHNLIDYLYYLFNKFINEDSESNTHMINKSNFVNICQTLVRNGSIKMSSPPPSEQLISEATMTNSCDSTLIQTFLREYRTDTNEITLSEASINSSKSLITLNDQDTWLIVDLEQSIPQASTPIADELKVSSISIRSR